MDRIMDNRSKLDQSQNELTQSELPAFYNRPVDDAWRYIVRGRREVWKFDERFRKSALCDLSALADQLRRLREIDPGIGVVLTHADATEPDWQDHTRPLIKHGRELVAVQSIALREYNLLLDFVAPPNSIDAARSILCALTRAAKWCWLLVQRDEVTDPLLWWGLELIRLAWAPHPAFQARRKFRHDVFAIDVEHFAAPRNPGKFWSVIFDCVKTAPRSWYAELSVELATASACLIDQFIITLNETLPSDAIVNGHSITNTRQSPTLVEGSIAQRTKEPLPLIDETQEHILVAMIEKFEGAKPGERCCPSGSRLALVAVGVTASGAIKRSLSELVKKGLLGNQKGQGKRGGYFLTDSGRTLAREIIHERAVCSP